MSTAGRSLLRPLWGAADLPSKPFPTGEPAMHIRLVTMVTEDAR